ncbi:MAG TPA: NUDIX domain-containing protein [Actinocrinis sp.]|nr:NUDIX domain-containing protein [Actinocrinis sp.]
MNERVRGVLVTPADTMLLIKRIRPDIAPYWVLPGGGVEPGNESREAALLREIREEIAGTAQIVSLLHILGEPGERHFFYLARVARWSFEDRSGPEFAIPGRGEYVLEQVPLTIAGLRSVDLKPDEIARFLRCALRRDGGLFALPDLRQAFTGLSEDQAGG